MIAYDFEGNGRIDILRLQSYSDTEAYGSEYFIINSAVSFEFATLFSCALVICCVASVTGKMYLIYMTYIQTLQLTSWS